MCDRAERRLLAEERGEEHYQELYAKVEDEMKAQYLKDFGPTYRAAHPFKRDHDLIDAMVCKRMRSGWDD